MTMRTLSLIAILALAALTGCQSTFDKFTVERLHEVATNQGKDIEVLITRIDPPLDVDVAAGIRERAVEMVALTQQLVDEASNE